MAKQKKSELDAVLEQLKMSYAAGLDDDLEDSLLDSDNVEEDAELSSILEKIFVDNDAQNSDEAEYSESVDAEAKKVDEVLDIMFGGAHIKNENVDASDEFTNACDEESHNTSLPSNQVEEVCEAVPETQNTEVLAAEEEVTSAVENKPIIMKSDIDESYDVVIGEIVTETVTETEISIFEPDEEFYPSEEIAEEISDGQIPEDESLLITTTYTEDAEIESSNDDESMLDETIPDEEPYIYDPLQQSLRDISFYKPQNDIDLSIKEAIPPEDEQAEVNTADPSESTGDVEDNDISLLLKFGYEGEISENGQGGHANKIIYKKSKEYKPASYKIKHGFTGKEYFELSQKSEIKKKYRVDKISLMIKAIIVSILAMISVSADVFNIYFNLHNGHYMFINLILAFTVAVILANRIFSGINSLIRFDANEYSLPSLILIEYLILAVCANLTILSSSEQNGYISFGGYTLLCVSLTVWSEFIDCCRESSVFGFLAEDNVRCAAERHMACKDSRSRYILRRTNFVSGYHNKTIENKGFAVNPFLMIGVLPIIAVIFSIAISIINEDHFVGINSAEYILFYSVPLSCTISLSMIRLFDHVNLKKNNAVYIGANACDSISKIESLVFEDTDVLEITSYIEIDPDNNSESQKKWLNFASNIFACLGGPLSKAMAVKTKPDANVDHDIIINSISYNGIDLHFDSSVNVLIGDRQYMLSRNIKVKTDINITGAVKGAERSVIYMAFDSIPRIGFILSSKIKKTFIDNVEYLCNNNINAEVRSYEPEINEYFFESNEIRQSITVEKPKVFESSEPSEVSDSNLVASNPYELCRAIVYSKRVSETKHKNKRIIIIQAVCGFMIACILSILQCLPLGLEVSKFLKLYSPIVLYCISVLMLIPNIIQIITTIKRKKFLK